MQSTINFEHAALYRDKPNCMQRGTADCTADEVKNGDILISLHCVSQILKLNLTTCIFFV